MKKKKEKKNESSAYAGFEITVKIPLSLYEKMERTDKDTLNDLSVHKSASLIYQKYVFRIGDILKVRNLLSKHNIRLKFPPAKEMKQFGINYTGDSLSIVKEGDTFVINQYFPDGELRTHLIPEARVWETYYLMKKLAEKEGKNRIEAREVWKRIAQHYAMHQFFDEFGNFMKNAFNGARGTYHNFYYYPLKVLQEIGKIEYSKKGEITLLTSEEIKVKREEMEKVKT